MAAAWTSDLSVAEFDVLRAVGFRPLGQVMGASVYFTGSMSTLGATGLPKPRPVGTAGLLAPPGRPTCSGGGRWGGSGNPRVVESAPLVASLHAVRSLALSRMQAEAAALGADGVVGVELTLRPFPAMSLAVEFSAIGTAVVANGRQHAPKPFLSNLSGQDFGKLLLAGWVPTGLAMGVGVVVRHDDWSTRTQASAGTGNTEISGFTEVVHVARQSARASLARDAQRLGGDGVVVRDLTMDVREQECLSSGQSNGKDHVAEVTILGTAITRFRTSAVAHPRTLPTLRLDPHRSDL